MADLRPGDGHRDFDERKVKRAFDGKFARVEGRRPKVAKVKKPHVRKVRPKARGRRAPAPAQTRRAPVARVNATPLPARALPPEWDKIKGKNARDDGLKLWERKKLGEFPSNVEFYKAADQYHREWRKKHPGDANYASKNMIANAAYRHELEETGGVKYLEWPDDKRVNGPGKTEVKKVTEKKPVKANGPKVEKPPDDGIQPQPGQRMDLVQLQRNDQVTKGKSKVVWNVVRVTSGPTGLTVKVSRKNSNGVQYEDYWTHIEESQDGIFMHNSSFAPRSGATAGNVDKPSKAFIESTWYSSPNPGSPYSKQFDTDYGVYGIEGRNVGGGKTKFEVYAPIKFGDPDSRPGDEIVNTFWDGEEAKEWVASQVGRNLAAEKKARKETLAEIGQFQIRYPREGRKWEPREFHKEILAVRQEYVNWAADDDKIEPSKRNLDKAKKQAAKENFSPEGSAQRASSERHLAVAFEKDERSAAAVVKMWHMLKEQYPEIKWHDVENENQDYNDADLRRFHRQGLRHNQMAEYATTLHAQLYTYPMMKLVGCGFQKKPMGYNCGGLCVEKRIKHNHDAPGNPLIPRSDGRHMTVNPENSHQTDVVTHEMGHVFHFSTQDPDFMDENVPSQETMKVLTDLFKSEVPRKSGESDEHYQGRFNAWISDTYPSSGLTNYSFMRASLHPQHVALTKTHGNYLISNHESIADSWEEVHRTAGGDEKRIATSAQQALVRHVISKLSPEGQKWLEDHRDEDTLYHKSKLPPTPKEAEALGFDVYLGGVKKAKIKKPKTSAPPPSARATSTITKQELTDSIEYEVAKPATRNSRVYNSVDFDWQMETFMYNKEHIREGVRIAQTDGYNGVDENEFVQLGRNIPMDTDQDDDFVMDDEAIAALQVEGGELVARAVHSQPTKRKLYRGAILDRAWVENLSEGREISMPASAWAPNEEYARDYGYLGDDAIEASGRDYSDYPDDGKSTLFVLEPGAQVAKVTGEAHGGLAEYVGFGKFEVVSAEEDGDYHVVTVRQVSMVEDDNDAIPRSGAVALAAPMPKPKPNSRLPKDDDEDDGFDAEEETAELHQEPEFLAGFYGVDEPEDPKVKAQQDREKMARITRLIAKYRSEGRESDVPQAWWDFSGDKPSAPTSIEPVSEGDPDSFDLPPSFENERTGNFDELTHAEENAVINYKFNSYGVNNDLRDNTLDEEGEATVKLLDAAMNKSKLPQRTVVKRLITGDFKRRFKVGDVYSDKAYMSTQRADIPGWDPQRMYDNYATTVDPNPVLLMIEMPEGANALTIDDKLQKTFSDVAENEPGEIVIPRGAKFDIVDVQSGHISWEDVSAGKVTPTIVKMKLRREAPVTAKPEGNYGYTVDDGKTSGVVRATDSEGTKVGHLLYNKYTEDDGQEIIMLNGIHVEEANRRQGISTQIVRQLHKQFPDAWLNFGPRSDDGEALYRKLLKDDELAPYLMEAPKDLKSNLKGIGVGPPKARKTK